MSTKYPNPNELFPIQGIKRTAFLKNIMKHPQILIGDFTYYDDPDDVSNFEKHVLYLFDFIDYKLIIGKFCQIATGVRFIMNGANHAMGGVSTYPFKVMGGQWGQAVLDVTNKGDTVIGNDVWIGNGATIMQGIHIGDGAIIAANSVVTKDVKPYTVVGGNPHREIRARFDEETIQFLVDLKWWDWDLQKITEHLDLLTSGNIEKLKQIYQQ